MRIYVNWKVAVIINAWLKNFTNHWFNAYFVKTVNSPAKQVNYLIWYIFYFHLFKIGKKLEILDKTNNFEVNLIINVVKIKV